LVVDVILSSLELDIIEGENPVMDGRYIPIEYLRRVELFGNAAQNGW
jgi:hypothetical protein